MNQQISSLKQTEGSTGMPTVRASPEQLRWTLFQSAPDALPLPDSGLAASSASTTQPCGQVVTMCFLAPHHAASCPLSQSDTANT